LIGTVPAEKIPEQAELSIGHESTDPEQHYSEHERFQIKFSRKHARHHAQCRNWSTNHQAKLSEYGKERAKSNARIVSKSSAINGRNDYQEQKNSNKDPMNLAGTPLPDKYDGAFTFRLIATHLRSVLIRLNLLLQKFSVLSI
jgi:hypothetical protein